MKVRDLTQRGKFQRVRRMKKRVRRKKTYSDRERNSQRDSKWIHVDQVLHQQDIQWIYAPSPRMAPFLFLLLFLSEAASDLIVVVCSGQDAILPCQAADSSISVVEWSRPDLEEYVLLYRDGRLDPTLQNPSFKDRVELVDRELKDGDVSLTLKNVSSIDNGTYECRVAPDSSSRKKRAIIDSEPIRIIRLQVTEPGSEDRNSSPVGRHVGLGVGGSLLLVAVAVVGVLIYKRRKEKRSGPPADDDDNASAAQFI